MNKRIQSKVIMIIKLRGEDEEHLLLLKKIEGD